LNNFQISSIGKVIDKEGLCSEDDILKFSQLWLLIIQFSYWRSILIYGQLNLCWWQWV